MTIRDNRPAAATRKDESLRATGREAVIGLLRAADLLGRRLGGATGCEAISPPQYNVLRILRGAGDAGLPTLEIGNRMIEQAPGITRLLDRLEARSLVRRERCLRDRRQVLCYITPQGLELLSRLDPSIDAVGDDLRSSLTGDEARALVLLLGRVSSALAT
ncbi:MAG: MarR family transcriptional regulator [Thermoanaerobaculia bacterium]